LSLNNYQTCTLDIYSISNIYCQKSINKFRFSFSVCLPHQAADQK
jgi:hypothetical protein